MRSAATVGDGARAGLRYVLGLDLGVASVGWAVVRLGEDGAPAGIIRMGTHLFEAGIDAGKSTPEAALAAGKEASRATPRRLARQQRRQTWRRAARKRRLLRTLQRYGLLPEGDTRDGAAIDAYMKALDAGLRETWNEGADHRTHQILPYRLRAAALERRLEPYEVGRALYHLAQRRGFLSNRKTDRGDEDQEAGKVKQGIADLAAAMERAGAPTLGAYFASLDPTNPEERRIRERWTDRRMYVKEFEAIWGAQAEHHPELMTEEAREAVRCAIFFQRPLKSQRHLIGRCRLIPSRRRCAVADRAYQRLRLLQKVNDLRYVDTATGEERGLTPEQRAALIQLLEAGDVPFSALKRTRGGLGLPKSVEFNLERGGEKKIVGHRTDEKLRKVFGEERWGRLSEADRAELVEDVLTIENPDALERRGRERWGLPADAAVELARVRLEGGYAPFSRRAILRLLPHLERGVPLQTAIKEEFPASFEAAEAMDLLPPVIGTGPGGEGGAFRDPPSPAVTRGLSELRKVVNAIIRRWGKPERIHLEMARDLKKGRKQREEAAREMRAREKEREEAKRKLLEEAGIEHPSREDIEKVLLAEECGWTCPFTGRCFEMRDLVGPTPSVDVEHIWPFRRSLDNTFLNKTLCLHEENRHRKRDRTPFEAYGADPQRYGEILQRVARFKGGARREKLRRFAATEIDEGFTERHLAETRYVSRKAAEYLALLYGGLWDADGTRRVQVSTGGLTAWLRRNWGIDGLVGAADGEGGKARDDHRHHAVDALVVALSDARAVKRLSEAARAAAENGGGRLLAEVERPWEGFERDAREAVASVVVSHRADRRVSGALHKDTIFSRPIRGVGTSGEGGHRLRKALHKLSRDEVEAIADPRIRDLVRAALESRGGGDPAKVFADPAAAPVLEYGDGRRVRVRKVRVDRRERPRAFGQGGGRRYVAPQSNHHTVILARVGPDGRDVEWRDEPVPLWEAYERIRRGEPVVDTRDREDGWVFRFSLVVNEYIEMDRKDGGGRGVYRILNISGGDMEIREHFDGRTRQAIRAAGSSPERVSGSSLLRRNARKVRVTHLGEVVRAGG